MTVSPFSGRTVIVAWQLMFAAILLDLVMVEVAVTSANTPLYMPDGVTYVAKAIAPLVVFGLALLCMVAIETVRARPPLQAGTVFGLAGGLLQIAHMILENFWGRIGESSIVTLAFMLGGFLIWSVAAYAAADRSGDSLDGVVAGLWSATTSVLLAVTFGLILMTAGIPAAAYVETWQEFKNSGWTNARAFGIANSLDAVFGHFIAGPIFGLVCGVLGAGMTAVVRRRR